MFAFWSVSLLSSAVSCVRICVGNTHNGRVILSGDPENQQQRACLWHDAAVERYSVSMSLTHLWRVRDDSASPESTLQLQYSSSWHYYTCWILPMTITFIRAPARRKHPLSTTTCAAQDQECSTAWLQIGICCCYPQCLTHPTDGARGRQALDGQWRPCTVHSWG